MFKRWIHKVSPEGYPYSVWEMPMSVRVPPHWLDCSFYVYKTVAEAQAGKHTGGSGCLIGVPSTHSGWFHLYAVTNRHVVNSGYGVLRLNTHEGKMDTVETQWSQWETLDESGDVAVMPLDLGSHIRWKPIMLEEFMTPETLEGFSIWPGDEAFMIGRLINQSGRQRNTPVVRFGTIAMLPDSNERVSMEPYGEHEAFLVECRSISGFSGSPVFLTTTQVMKPKDGKPARPTKYVSQHDRIGTEPPPPLPQPEGGVKLTAVLMQGTWGPWFIGVDRGHVPLWKPVFSIDEDTRHIDQQTETGYRVEHNTGIACVISSWRIVDILNKESLVKQRKKDDAEIARRQSESTIADLEVDPRPERAEFDRVLTNLLNAPPVTREEVHKETRKRKKRASKVIEGDITKQ